MCNAFGVLFYLNPVGTFTFYIPNINIILFTINKIVNFPTDILLYSCIKHEIKLYLCTLQILCSLLEHRQVMNVTAMTVSCLIF